MGKALIVGCGGVAGVAIKSGQGTHEITLNVAEARPIYVSCAVCQGGLVVRSGKKITVAEA